MREVPEKIMIIEDDPVIRTELETLLSGNGFLPCVVTDFERTVCQVKDENPRLILLDIKLPGKSGFYLCSEIRSFSDVPVIFVTSSNTDMDELNSIMLGGDAFITKPYNTAILLAKIRSLLKRAWPGRQNEGLSWHGAVFHPEEGTLEYDDRKVELTKKRTEDPVLSLYSCRCHLLTGGYHRLSLGQQALCGRQCAQRQYQPDT